MKKIPKIKKVSFKSIQGTSFQGYVTVSDGRIIANKLGKSNVEGEYGPEWNLKFGDVPFTIYRYKPWRAGPEFHIGFNDKQVRAGKHILVLQELKRLGLNTKSGW